MAELSSSPAAPAPATADPLATRRRIELGRWLGGVRKRLSATFGYPPFLVLLGLGFLVRIALMATYFPAIMLSFDSPRFARAGPTGLFDDYWMPAGYAMFLEGLRTITDQLWFTIGVQHLLGLVVGAVVFWCCRRLGAGPALSCVPAGVIFLSGDGLYLEHIVMADFPLFAAGIISLALLARGLVPKPSAWWLVAGGVLAMTAMLMRSVGVVLVLVTVVCALGWGGSGWIQRLRSAALVAAGALVLFVGYVAFFEVKDGRYLGITDMSGWNLYARVAPFAECSEFTPPAGARVLCDRRPPAERPGPFGFSWDENSAARKNFPLGPGTGKVLNRFAREAIVAQPFDYGRAVLIDLIRYVEPTVGTATGYNGQPRELISFGWRDPGTEAIVVKGMSKRYSGTEVHVSRIGAIESYQQLFRVDRMLLLLFLILTVVGGIVARGPLCLGVFLFGLTGTGLFVLPTLTLSYDFRYGIPPTMFVVVSGTLAVAALIERRARVSVAR